MMRQYRLLSLLGFSLLLFGCAKAPAPAPPVNAPEPVVVTPVSPRKPEHARPKQHLFRGGEQVRLEAPGGGKVWVFASGAALDANDTDKAWRADAGTIARVHDAYPNGALEVVVTAGDRKDTHGSVRRRDVVWFDGKVWKR